MGDSDLTRAAATSDSSLFCDLSLGRSASSAVALTDREVPEWAEGTALGLEHSFEVFGCEVPNENPDTPDKVRPDVVFRRKVFTSGDLVMPDRRSVRYWGFEDPSSAVRKPFPSPPIRVREGQIVHTIIEAGKGPHTIHHHGIEPIPFNDGVGHTSFEVNGSYTYQWRPQDAGTFIYHCHRNTVLHFEMGMYGLLIVDPAAGPGRVYTGGPAYDVEAFHVVDDLDPRWRGKEHAAGLCGGDEGLNDFRPAYFVINGVPNPRSLTNRTTAVSARVGQSILLRHVNASYSVVSTTFGGLDAEVVAVDGRPLVAPFSQPIAIPSGQAIESVSSQRHDVMLRPSSPGTFTVRNEFRQWISGRLHGVAESRITVT